MENGSTISAVILAAFGNQNLYEILDISSPRDATEETIKKQFKRMALKYHPDKGGSASTFQALTIVHSILSDPSRRKKYDRNGSIDESPEDRFEEWRSTFSSQFSSSFKSTFEIYKKGYANSKRERRDILRAYEEFDGDIDKIGEDLMLWECSLDKSDHVNFEKARLIKIVDKAIERNDIVLTSSYAVMRADIISTMPKYFTNVDEVVIDDNEEEDYDVIDASFSHTSKRNRKRHRRHFGIGYKSKFFV